jgi:NDP-sugar pyrophosphorylase family protein
MLTCLYREDTTSVPDRVSAADVCAFDALLLAGTHTWRRTAFDQLLPRPILPVGHLPLMAHPLRWLRDAGARRVTICANGLGPQLQEHLEPVRHLVPDFSFHEDETPRGAAGSARDAALATDGDVFVVADATTIPDVNLLRVLREHEASRAVLTIIVQPTLGGREKSLIPTGLYIFSRRAFEYVPAAGYQDIKESLIPRLYAAGQMVLTSEAENACPRVLDARTYLAVSHRTIARSSAARSRLSEAIGPVDDSGLIHPGARVSPSALLVGPVMVGANVEIRDGAVIVGPASIAADSVVGAGALISRSIIWSGCTIGASATVDRSILSTGVIVAPGARVVGAIEVTPRPAAARRVRRSVPVPHTEPAVSTRGLAFR